MCLVCAQISASDRWTRDPRDSNDQRVAGGAASTSRHQESARRLKILNALVASHRLKIRSDDAGGYLIASMTGKTASVSSLDELWYTLRLRFACVVDVLDS